MRRDLGVGQPARDEAQDLGLGEELLFRGLLLPRMQGVFGRWDWAGNGVLFALYHVHVPWVIPQTFVDTLVPLRVQEVQQCAGRNRRAQCPDRFLHGGRTGDRALSRGKEAARGKLRAASAASACVGSQKTPLACLTRADRGKIWTC